MMRIKRSIDSADRPNDGVTPVVPAFADRLVARLSLYRRVLEGLPPGESTVYSHRLGALCGTTAAQVRRDLMTIGFGGSPARGYHVSQLAETLGLHLDQPEGQFAALAGVGNLGRALLDYFATRRPSLRIVAAFDTDPQKVNRVVHGCRVWPLADLERVAREHTISVGVITVPAASAQTVAEAMLAAGIRGFLNFAPTPLRLPVRTYVEEMDITTSMEKVAYFARLHSGGRERTHEPNVR